MHASHRAHVSANIVNASAAALHQQARGQMLSISSCMTCKRAERPAKVIMTCRCSWKPPPPPSFAAHDLCVSATNVNASAAALHQQAWGQMLTISSCMTCKRAERPAKVTMTCRCSLQPPPPPGFTAHDLCVSATTVNASAAALHQQAWGQMLTISSCMTCKRAERPAQVIMTCRCSLQSPPPLGFTAHDLCVSARLVNKSAAALHQQAWGQMLSISSCMMCKRPERPAKVVESC